MLIDPTRASLYLPRHGLGEVLVIERLGSSRLRHAGEVAANGQKDDH
jgi:hypothetical protein